MQRTIIRMRAPVDYPVEDANQSAQSELDEITYAALIDRHLSEQPITSDMIRTACLKMEAAQQFPFADKEKPQFFSSQAAVTSKQSATSTDKTRVLPKFWNR